jgi:hypothetical protein
MVVRHHRPALAGVITAICRAFLAATLSAMNPHRGTSMGPHHGETARHGGVFAALLAAIALLAAACGGSPGSHAAQRGSTATQSSGALAFSRCMRSRGVPNFPDPTGSGGIPKETEQQLGISSSQYQAAHRACAHLLPNSGGPTQAQIQQDMNGMWEFARCMRSHGVTDWPDPTTDPGGYPNFYLQGKIDINSPQTSTKMRECAHLIPPYWRSNGGAPGGVDLCPGDKPGPGARGACG